MKKWGRKIEEWDNILVHIIKISLSRQVLQKDEIIRKNWIILDHILSETF